MDALCRLDYQAASQYCTWKLLETTWKCFVSFWMASAIESLSLLSSLSRCNQNWTHTIMHHAFKTWCIVSTNGRYAIKTPDFDKKSGVFLTFWYKMKHPEIPVGLAVGLAPFLAKLDEVKNPTFWRKLDLFFTGSKMQIRSYFAVVFSQK